MERLKFLALFIWYAIGLYFVSLWARGPFVRAYGPISRLDAGYPAYLDVVSVLSGGAVLLGLFLLLPGIARTTLDGILGLGASNASGSRIGAAMGAWLCVGALLNTAGLLIVFGHPVWLMVLLPSGAVGETMIDALTSIFAAGVGGSIATIDGDGNADDASGTDDFQSFQVLVVRLVLSMLLGLIVFFLLKCGLLGTVPTEPQDNLNDAAVAGIGGLVGLFSKNAIEKLREVFNVVFATGKRAAEIERGVPDSDRAARVIPDHPDRPNEARGKSVGSGVTFFLFGCLLFSSLFYAAGLMWFLSHPNWPISLPPAGEIRETVFDALISVFAAGVGGSITTILAFLKHVSEDQDFATRYFPFYVGRPIMGMLLGLIMFFLLKGGLLATLPTQSLTDLNDATLAGIGGLVGLFSKNAIEKLRELFNVAFATKKAIAKGN